MLFFGDIFETFILMWPLLDWLYMNDKKFEEFRQKKENSVWDFWETSIYERSKGYMLSLFRRI